MNLIDLLIMLICLLIVTILSYVAGHRQGSIRGRFQAYREMEVPVKTGKIGLQGQWIELDTIDSETEWAKGADDEIAE